MVGRNGTTLVTGKLFSPPALQYFGATQPLRSQVPQYDYCMGAQPLICRRDLYRLSFVLRQGAAERHAN